MLARRGFLGAIIGAAGLAGAAEVSAAPVARVEPVPTRFDFESYTASYIGCDVCATAVSEALATLGWDSSATIKPLLCVHPRYSQLLWKSLTCSAVSLCRTRSARFGIAIPGLWPITVGELVLTAPDGQESPASPHADRP